MGMIPAVKNFSVQRGSSGTYAQVSAQVQDPTGALVDLTGADVYITTSINRLAAGMSDANFVVDIPSATFAWKLTAAQTWLVPFGSIASYTVWIVFPDGSGGPYLRGYLNGDGALPGDPQIGAIVIIQGPAGAPGSSTFDLPSATPLAAYVVVKGVGSGDVGIASSASIGDMGSVVGITTEAAPAAQDLVTIINSGIITNPAWNWAIGPVYLGLSGALTQTQPTFGFSQQVGVAVSPTTLVAYLFPPETVLSDAFGQAVGRLPD